MASHAGHVIPRMSKDADNAMRPGEIYTWLIKILDMDRGASM